MMKRCIAGLGATALLWVIPHLGMAQEEELSGGKLEYQYYCASCHGTDGKGSGPMANMLKVTPADLTQLSKKHEGKFPFWKVYRIIDGREPILSGHGTREMPIWGDRFQLEAAGAGAADASLVRGRIFQLVHYLQSIQAE